MIFTGNANVEFANKVTKCLDIELGKASISKFSDGEIAIELLENVYLDKVLFLYHQQTRLLVLILRTFPSID